MIRAATRAFRLLRTAPKAHTPEAAGHRRLRRVLVGAGTAAAATGISAIVTIVTTPLVLRTVGPERFGLIMTITGLGALVGFADLGLGNGLQNNLIRAVGTGDTETAQRAVSSVLVVLAAIASVVGLTGIVAHQFVPWASILRVTDTTAQAELPWALAVFFGVFVVSIPFGVMRRILAAHQEDYVANAWRGIGLLGSLIWTISCVATGAGVPWFVASYAFVALVPLVWAAAVEYFRKPQLRPSFGSASLTVAAPLVRSGSLFFLLQISSIVSVALDNVVLSTTLGPSTVAHYSVVWRMFMLVTTALGFVLTPLWPAYGDAIARGETAWVKRQFIRSLKLVFLSASAAATLLALVGPFILKLWIGPDFQATHLLLGSIALWTIFAAMGGALSAYLNAANVIAPQVRIYLITSALSIGLKYGLCLILGEEGIPIGNLIGIGVIGTIPIALVCKRTLSEFETAASKGTPA